MGKPYVTRTPQDNKLGSSTRHPFPSIQVKLIYEEPRSDAESCHPPSCQGPSSCRGVCRAGAGTRAGAQPPPLLAGLRRQGGVWEDGAAAGAARPPAGAQKMTASYPAAAVLPARRGTEGLPPPPPPPPADPAPPRATVPLHRAGPARLCCRRCGYCTLPVPVPCGSSRLLPGYSPRRQRRRSSPARRRAPLSAERAALLRSPELPQAPGHLRPAPLSRPPRLSLAPARRPGAYFLQQSGSGRGPLAPRAAPLLHRLVSIPCNFKSPRSFIPAIPANSGLAEICSPLTSTLLWLNEVYCYTGYRRKFTSERVRGYKPKKKKGGRGGQAASI